MHWKQILAFLTIFLTLAASAPASSSNRPSGHRSGGGGSGHRSGGGGHRSGGGGSGHRSGGGGSGHPSSSTGSSRPSPPRHNFPGVDASLNYIPGSAIYNHYQSYKAADREAGRAAGVYRDQAQVHSVPRPWDRNNRPTGPVGGSRDRKYYHRNGHRAMQGYATAAANAAANHAAWRESFNTQYRDVLIAKNELDGHRRQAANARTSEQKYNGLANDHYNFANQ